MTLAMPLPIASLATSPVILQVQEAGCQLHCVVRKFSYMLPLSGNCQLVALSSNPSDCVFQLATAIAGCITICLTGYIPKLIWTSPMSSFFSSVVERGIAAMQVILRSLFRSREGADSFAFVHAINPTFSKPSLMQMSLFS
jgi:hypothetical protein